MPTTESDSAPLMIRIGCSKILLSMSLELQLLTDILQGKEQVSMVFTLLVLQPILMWSVVTLLLEMAEVVKMEQQVRMDKPGTMALLEILEQR